MRKAFLILGTVPLLLTACDFSLAGDVAPPAGAIISSEATLMPVEAPLTVPNLESGEEIYTNRCEPCHGVGGLGDGEQATQLPFFPPAIGDPELARAASLEEWFRVVSQGRIQRYMPPFETALTVQERWNVLAYVYRLGWDEETVALGKEIYISGKTEIDGLLANVPPLKVNFGSVEALGLPLTDAQALTAYLQAAALGIDAQPEEVPSPAETDNQTGSLGRFSGKVIYGNGDQLPDGLEARLYGFDHTDQIVSAIRPVSKDGSFEFSDIPLTVGRVFFVQVDYRGLSYFSEFLTVDNETSAFNLDVPIFDTTSDPSQLAVEKIQLVFDFPQAGTVRVVESVSISNLGDKAVTPVESGKPVLHFSLPPQASNLSFEEGALGDRYVPDENGFVDTRAVIPGINSYSLLFAYELPYETGIEFPVHVDLPTRSVVAFLPVGDIEMKSESFHLEGSQSINGTDHSVYVADVGYFEGDEIPLVITGDHPLGGSLNGITNDNNLLYGLAALTAAVGFAFFWLQRLPSESPESAELILKQIVSLDDQYKKGRLAKSAYNKKRRALKERLRIKIRKKNRK